MVLTPALFEDLKLGEEGVKRETDIWRLAC